MKAYMAKTILVLVLLAGEGLGLLAYNRVLFLFGEFLGITWISLILVFILSALLIRFGLRALVPDVLATTTFDQINLIRILKFLAAGFIGWYVILSLIGVPVLAVGLVLDPLIRNFFR